MSTTIDFGDINFGEVPDDNFGVDLKPGNYKARLMKTPELRATKEGNRPMLMATYEVLEGEYKGKEVNRFYVLGTKMVDGKVVHERGQIDLKGELKAIGETIPDGLRLNANNVVKFYGTKFSKKVVILNARSLKPKKEGDPPSTFYKIISLDKPVNAAAQAAATQQAALPAGTGDPPEAAADDFVEDEFA